MSESSTSPKNAYYAADVAKFIATTPDAILGKITANSAFAVDTAQRDAWIVQIEVLKLALEGVEGNIFLEFNVPRIGSRIDAVLISGPAIFVIEFKVGETNFKRDDLNQAWDYALDLKNFHKASHHAPIFPILVATHAPWSDTVLRVPHTDHVSPQFGAIRKDYGNSFTQRLTQQRAIASILKSGGIRLISRLPRLLRPRKHFTLNIPSMRLPATMPELAISR